MVLMPSAGLLLRDYVHRCLYDRADGYFEQAEAGVGA
jgi:SAM-dependent MidA family methyltransferase